MTENRSTAVPSSNATPSPRRGGFADALRGALRDGGPLLLAILAFAAIARIAYVSQFFATNPFAHAETLISDAKLYHEWAQRIAGGDLLGPAEPLHHPPLYPYLLGLVYAIAGPSPGAMVTLQSLVGLVTLLLVFAISRRVTSRGPALVVTALAALYWPFAFYETRLLPSSLATFTAALALAQLCGVFGNLTRGRLFLAGLALGILAGLRPNQLLALAFVVPVAGWLARDATLPRARIVNVLLLGLGALLPILPFTLRNVVHAGEAVLLCDTGGINLYFAHSKGAGASFKVDDPRWGNVEDQPAYSRRMAEAETQNPSLTWSEVSSHFTRKALDFAVAHPLDELRSLLARARAILDSFEYCVIYAPLPERAIASTSWLFPIPFAPFAALVLAGIVATLRTRPRDPLALVLLAYAIAQWAMVLIFFQYSRFRLVSMPALVPLAAIGLGQVVQGVRARRFALEFVAVAIGAVVSLLPETSEASDQRANQDVAIASAYRTLHDFAAANEALDRSERSRPGLVNQRLERVALFIDQKQFGGARAELETGLSKSPDQPLYLLTLAKLLVTTEPTDLARAADLARRATRLAPALIETWLELGRVLLAAKQWEPLRTAMQDAIAHGASSAPILTLLGSACRNLGDFDAARKALLHAIEIDPRFAPAQDELRRLP